MTAYPCPYCRTEASLATGCPGCGRGPDPDAAEVVRLDAEIPVLTARLAAAREAVAGADAALRRAWTGREAAATRVRAAVAAAAKAAPRPAHAPAMTAPMTTATAEASARVLTETSTRLVQNTLFTLGGLLLAVAAIVFTAVAWSQFGVRGRAGLLAVVTVVALAAPLAALRRRLTATAETFAAVGLLLVLLDGYAAWYVNLFGIADYSAYGYAGAVCAVTAAVAAGYEHVTGLVGPRFAALVVAQPVLPLLVAPLHPDATGWAYTMSAVALIDLAVVHLRRSALGPVGIAAYALGGIAVSTSGIFALVALALAGTTAQAALAASALVVAALVVLTGALGAPVPAARVGAGALVVVAFVIAAARFAEVAGGARPAPVLVAAVVAAAAVGVRLLPARVRRGPRIGALITMAPAALVALLDTAVAAATGDADWRLPAVLVVLTAGATVLLPYAAVGLGGATALALAAPAGLGLAWWAAPPLDLAVVIAALILAARGTPWAAGSAASAGAARPGGSAAGALRSGGSAAVGAREGGWAAGVAGLLVVHAVVVASAEAGVAAATLAAVAGIALVTAWRGPQWIGGAALATGLLALAPAAWQGAAALGWSAAVQGRVVLAAAAALVGTLWLIHRDRRWATAAVLLVVVSAPLGAYASGDSAAIYAAVGLVLIAASVPLLDVEDRVWAAAAAALLGAAWLAEAAGGLLTVFAGPWAHAGDRWSGPVAWADVAATATVAVAAGIGARLLRGWSAALWAALPVVAVAAVMGTAALRLPWPGVPAAALVTGLALLIVAALRGTARRAGAAVPVGAGLLAAALAAALATDAATMAAFGATVIAGVTVGAAGRASGARIAGWSAAAGSAFVTAYTAGRAVELTVAGTAFVVLAAAAAVLAGGALLRRPVESRVLQAAAHGGALVALLLTVGSARYAAAVCTLWGIALGLRALVRRAGGQRVHVVAAASAEVGGWWLLLAAEQVAVVEAYTIPAAGVALLAGLLARRSVPGLSSWAAYGPALAAALLPTLASVLTGEGEPLRRLLLGVAALAVLLAGSRARLQAPVVAGGVVLTLVALHEAALVWDLLPRWIPLAAAGLLLVGVAATLERRRRDVARVRAALTRMG
ncbi:hypothetical protein AB0368_20070 [Actinoplanes sp. NPDC051475]|uniref:SCO7613 C-terminal domain-containing membrane protein n=1 Tax=Actinoplanes sp. NPDC051475 TaxID=3157225 RepID=UPI0034507B93